MSNQKITVTTRLNGQDFVAGTLFINGGGAVFHYATEYLQTPGTYSLAPSLPLVGGALPLDGLGGFSDSAPDR